MKRNHVRYLSGVYAYTGFGDASSAEVVWEAFAHLKNHKENPRLHTRRGQRIEEWLRAGAEEMSEQHKEFAKLTNPQHMNAEFELVRPLLNGGREPTEEQRRVYVTSIRTSENLVAKQRRIWIPALSSTQPVEKTFLDYDNNVSRNSGGKKGKKSAPAGKDLQLDFTSAKVTVAQARAAIERKQLKVINAREKSSLKKAPAKKHIKRVAEAEMEQLRATPGELKRARKQLKGPKERRTRPRGGVSVADSAMLKNFEADYLRENFRPARRRMAQLMADGALIEVSISCTCYPSNLCLRRENNKGARGKMLTCQKCAKMYHVKCLIGTGFVSKADTKDVEFAFDCPACAGAPLG